MNPENGPEYTPPPAGPLAERPSPVAPAASPLNFTPAKALGFAAALLLVLYAFWPALQPLLARPRRAPAAAETPASAAGAVNGEGVPAAPAPVQAGGLTAPEGGLDRENIVPPRPGLLVAPPTPIDKISYTGPAPSPADLDKDTSEDRAGCDAGDMFKCLRLGFRYIAGHGVKRDAARGFTLLNKACAGGIAEACTSQGMMQLTGNGTARDEAAAFALFEKACGAGDQYGCTMLASGYLGETNTPAEISRSLGLLGKACEGKIAQACTLLGSIYAEGKLAPRDAGAAARLLGKGCGLNDKNACQLRQQLEANAAEAGR